MARAKDIIESPSEIELLASTTRQEIVDTLESLGGEASVSEIASQLGRPSDGLYYHLRLLVAGGLLLELGDEGQGRRYRTRVGEGERFRLRYEPGATRNARAVERVASGMLRTAGRDFAAAIRNKEVVADGPLRTVWASRCKGWVADKDLEEMNELLERLVTLLGDGERDPNSQLVSLTFVVAPIPPKPVRRG